MKVTIITILTLTLIYLMTFNASVLQGIVPSCFYNENLQTLIHFVLFSMFSLIVFYFNNSKLSLAIVLLFAISLELIQYFINYRSIQIVDLFSNIVAVLVSKVAAKIIYK